MSDDDRTYDELRRRLADEARADAPRDLAGAVMRQVRSEPRPRDHRILRPMLTLVAAAALVVAALFGLSRVDLGAAGSSASSSGAGGGQAETRAATSAAGGAESGNDLAKDNLTVRHVPHAVLQSLSVYGVPACHGSRRIALSVPAPAFRKVARRVRGAAVTDAVVGERTYDVELHRAPQGQTRIRITCP
jgi:hypothetical protein